MADRHEERRRAGEPAQDPRAAPRREAGAEGEVGEALREGRVPAPAPEEAPELLGERSDYPVPFGDES